MVNARAWRRRRHAMPVRDTPLPPPCHLGLCAITLNLIFRRCGFHYFGISRAGRKDRTFGRGNGGGGGGSSIRGSARGDLLGGALRGGGGGLLDQGAKLRQDSAAVIVGDLCLCREVRFLGRQLKKKTQRRGGGELRRQQVHTSTGTTQEIAQYDI